MPVDKFGRMSDLKTKDTGVSLTYINNNYVRSDGDTPLSGSLDMRGNTIYNVADPVNPQDVVTKVYVDNTKGSGVIGRKVGDAVSIKENLDFLGKQRIKNLPEPVDEKDAVTKEYVDTTTAPFLKLDQTKYNTKGDIDMGDQFTVLNVKTPIDDNHIVDKKYVDEMDNLKSAFTFKNGEYYAKGNIYLRKNKLGGLREPTTDQEPATKKYVDDLQTQYIDKRGNIKFDRNINVGNHRIFAVKDPKKDYEATNKKYVDDTITKRLQEEKDNFLPQDPATKEYVDETIKGLAGGNLLVSKEGVFIKANGHYRATASLDIDNHKMENLPDPVDDKDAVNKKYIDGIVENLTLKQGLIRENGGFNLVDSYINMNFHNIRNVGLPKDESDAVPRRFVDSMIKEVEEKIEKIDDDIKKRTHIISVTASYQGDLIKDDFQFTFGGQSVEKSYKHNRYNGFLVPYYGYIKSFEIEIPGLKFSSNTHFNLNDFERSLENKIFRVFSLWSFDRINLSYEIGFLTIEFYFSEKTLNCRKKFITKAPKDKLRVDKGEILNIKSEIQTANLLEQYKYAIRTKCKFLDNDMYYPINDVVNEFFTYLVTILIELDPL